MQAELDKVITTRTSGPTKSMLARECPTDHEVNFSLYTKQSLVTVQGSAEFDGERLWVRSKTFANNVMIDGDAKIDVWELTYTLKGERVKRLMVSHTAMEGFLND